MPTLLSFYNASTGAAVTDMSATMVSQWVRVHTGRPISFQAKWNATGTPRGAFSWQFTDDDPNEYADKGVLTAAATDATESVTPTQPAGTADNTIIARKSMGDFARVKYTLTSGGTGTTFSVKLDASLRVM